MKNEEKKNSNLEEGKIIESPVIRNREEDVADSDRSSGGGTPLYVTSNTTLQSPQEHEHDKTVDPTLDETREVSGDDLHDIKAGKITGRDDEDSDN